MFLVKFGPDGTTSGACSWATAATPERRASRSTDRETCFWPAASAANSISAADRWPERGGYDIFLAKFDPAGTHVWSRRFGDIDDYQEALSVATGPSGVVVIAGYFRGDGGFRRRTAGERGRRGHLRREVPVRRHARVEPAVRRRRLAGGAKRQRLRRGKRALYRRVLRHRRFRRRVSGERWERGYFHSDAQRERPTCGAGGTAIPSGRRLGVSPRILHAASSSRGISTASSTSATDLWRARVETSSSRNSTRTGSSGAGVSATPITSTRRVSPPIRWAIVYLTGYFVGRLDFGGGPLIQVGTTYDLYLVKFDPSGAHVWSRRFGGPDWEETRSVAVDGSGKTLLTGSFGGALNFGNGSLTCNGDSRRFPREVRAAGSLHSGAPVTHAAASGDSSELSESVQSGHDDSLHTPSDGTVNLAIYDISGRMVRTLVAAPKTAGEHAASWDGRDDGGSLVASGVYLVRVEAGGQAATRKILLLK